MLLSWGAAVLRPTKKVRCDAMKSIARLEQSMQDRFLHVHAVFGLVQDDRLRAIEDFRRDFQAAVCRKTVHEDGIRRAEAGGEINERVADVVAVASVGKLEAAQRSEFFFQRKKIGKRLAGMKLVGKRVDHGDAGIRGHFFEDALLIDACDDALYPALEVASDIGDGLSRTERGGCLRVIQEDHRTTHTLNADIEGDARA